MSRSTLEPAASALGPESNEARGTLEEDMTMERRALVSSLVLISLISLARGASAQLVAAKDGPVVYGHHHLSTSNIEAQKKFFADTLGGTAMTIGTKRGSPVARISSSSSRPAAGFTAHATVRP